jgi:sec-independent protein translocase protein TatC
MKDPETGPMPLLGHLEELRRRIFVSLIVVVVAAVVAYFFSRFLQDFLTRPVGRLVFVAPTEAFVTRLKIAVFTGLAAASPFVFYQFWRFVRPALMANEARYMALAVVSSTVFFAGGLAFALFVVLPIGIRFLLSFETPELTAMISISRYVDFAGMMLLAFGLVFQLPVVVFFLTRLGIVKPSFLSKHRKVAIIALLVIAAVLTPPDIFTQLLMAVPLLALYELSLLVSRLAARQRRLSTERDGPA